MVFNVLKNKNFRFFFAADIISQIGSSMSFIGFNWYIFEQTKSNTAVGMLLSLSIMAGFLVFPFAGTLADRLNRKTIIIASNLIRGILILLLSIYSLLAGRLPVVYLYFLAVLGGAGWTILLPASRGIVQEILDRNDLINGNSLIEISLQLSSFTAAALAGFIYRFFGLTAIIFFDAVTFFVATLFILLMVYKPFREQEKMQIALAAVPDEPSLPGDQKKAVPFFQDFYQGIGYLMRNRWVLGLGIVSILPFVATMGSNVVLPGYVRDHLLKDSVVFGFADMAYGIGAFMSGFIAAFMTKRFKRFKAMLLFFSLSLAALFFLAHNRLVLGLYGGGFIFGLGNSSLRIIFNTTLMEIVPKKFFGRATAVWMASSYLFQIFSFYLVGQVMDWFTIPSGFLVLLAIMVIALVGGIYFLPRLEKEPAVQTYE